MGKYKYNRETKRTETIIIENENVNTNQKIEFKKARKNLQDTYINEQTKYLQK